MNRGTTCCTTPSALCFWGAAFLILYGAALLAVELWPALVDYQLAMVLGAIGGACLVNAAINRTFHCFITGPLFLILGAVAAADTAGLFDVSRSLLWAVALIGTGSALLLEHPVRLSEYPIP